MKKVISIVITITYILSLIVLYLGIYSYNWITGTWINLLGLIGGFILTTSIGIILLVYNGTMGRMEDKYGN